MSRPLPGLEELEGLARAMAKRRARVAADNDDLIQEGLMAVHAAALQGTTAEHPWRLAKTIMQRAMARFYKRQRCRAPEGEPIAGLAPIPARLGSEHQDRILGLEYFDALEKKCGSTARRAIENLYEVRDPEVLIVVMEQDNPRVTAKAVRSALGMRPKSWRSMMREVREFTTEWNNGHVH